MKIPTSVGPPSNEDWVFAVRGRGEIMILCSYKF
jgi:hypothetical protein